MASAATNTGKLKPLAITLVILFVCIFTFPKLQFTIAMIKISTHPDLDTIDTEWMADKLYQHPRILPIVKKHELYDPHHGLYGKNSPNEK